MTIGGLGSGSVPAPKPAAGGDVTKLEQQKKSIQEEMKRVDKNDKLAPEAKKKQLASLEKKLRKIEQAIQKATTASAADPKTSTSVSEQAKTGSPADDDLKSILQNSESKTEDGQERLLKKKLGEAGELLDLYA